MTTAGRLAASHQLLMVDALQTEVVKLQFVLFSGRHVMQVCSDIPVGSEMIRGISGGQKKRVTTGTLCLADMLCSRSCLCMAKQL